jgi:hypothetical protein
LIKALEKDNIKPMQRISGAKASVLLQPLLGTCHYKDVDIWRYNICVGKQVSQELLPHGRTDGKEEKFDLGTSNFAVENSIKPV